MPSPNHQNAQQIYAEAMDAARNVIELTRVMKRRAAKRIAEPMVRSSNSVCNNFLLAWQARQDPAAFKDKLKAAVQDAQVTRDKLSEAADANQMPVERTRMLVKIYDALIIRLKTLLEPPA